MRASSNQNGFRGRGRGRGFRGGRGQNSWPARGGYAGDDIQLQILQSLNNLSQSMGMYHNQGTTNNPITIDHPFKFSAKNFGGYFSNRAKISRANQASPFLKWKSAFLATKSHLFGFDSVRENWRDTRVGGSESGFSRCSFLAPSVQNLSNSGVFSDLLDSKSRKEPRLRHKKRVSPNSRFSHSDPSSNRTHSFSSTIRNCNLGQNSSQRGRSNFRRGGQSRGNPNYKNGNGNGKISKKSRKGRSGQNGTNKNVAKDQGRVRSGTGDSETSVRREEVANRDYRNAVLGENNDEDMPQVGSNENHEVVDQADSQPQVDTEQVDEVNFRDPNEPHPNDGDNNVKLNEKLHKGQIKPTRLPHIPANYKQRFDDPISALTYYPNDLPRMEGDKWPVEWRGKRWAGHHMVNMPLGHVAEMCRYLDISRLLVTPYPYTLDRNDMSSWVTGLTFATPMTEARFTFFMSHAMTREDPFYRVRYAPFISASFIHADSVWTYNPPDMTHYRNAVCTVLELAKNMDQRPEKWVWIRDDTGKLTVDEVVGYEQAERLPLAASNTQIAFHKKHCKSYNYRFRPLVVNVGENLERPDRHLTVLFDEKNFTMNQEAYKIHIAEKRKFKEIKPYFMHPKVEKTAEISVKRDRFIQDQKRRRDEAERRIQEANSSGVSQINSSGHIEIVNSVSQIRDDLNQAKVNIETRFVDAFKAINDNKGNIDKLNGKIRDDRELYKKEKIALINGVEKILTRIAPMNKKTLINNDIGGKSLSDILTFGLSLGLGTYEKCKKISLNVVIKEIFSDIRTELRIGSKRARPKTASLSSIPESSKKSKGSRNNQSTPVTHTQARPRALPGTLAGTSAINPLDYPSDEGDKSEKSDESSLFETPQKSPQPPLFPDSGFKTSTTQQLMEEDPPVEPPSITTSITNAVNDIEVVEFDENDSQETLNITASLSDFEKETKLEKKYVLSADIIRQHVAAAKKNRTLAYAAISSANSKNTAYSRFRRWRGILAKNLKRVSEILETWAKNPTVAQCATFVNRKDCMDFCKEFKDLKVSLVNFISDPNRMAESFKWSPDMVDIFIPIIPEPVMIALLTAGKAENWGIQELTNEAMVGQLLVNAAFRIALEKNKKAILDAPEKYKGQIGSISIKKSDKKKLKKVNNKVPYNEKLSFDKRDFLDLKDSNFSSDLNDSGYDKECNLSDYEMISEPDSSEFYEKMVDFLDNADIPYFENAVLSHDDEFIGSDSQNSKRSFESEICDESKIENVRSDSKTEEDFQDLIDDFIFDGKDDRRKLLESLKSQNKSDIFQTLKKFRSAEDLARALALIGLKPEDNYSNQDLKIAFEKLQEFKIKQKEKEVKILGDDHYSKQTTLMNNVERYYDETDCPDIARIINLFSINKAIFNHNYHMISDLRVIPDRIRQLKKTINGLKYIPKFSGVSSKDKNFLKLPDSLDFPKTLPETRFIKHNANSATDTNKGEDFEFMKEIALINNDMVKKDKSNAECWIINCNINNVTSTKLLRLVSHLSHYHIFCINEAFVHVDGLIDGSVIPRGFVAFWGTPDDQGLIYSFFLVKQEIRHYCTKIETLGTFSAILIESEKNMGPEFAIINTYRLGDASARYKKGFGETNAIFWSWLDDNIKKVKEKTEKIILVGDLNVDIYNPRNASEASNAVKLEKRVSEFTEHIKSPTNYRTQDKRAAQLDYVFTKKVSIPKCKNLNLCADLGHNGHVGQELLTYFNNGLRPIMRMTLSVPLHDPDVITRAMAVCSDFFQDILNRDFTGEEKAMRIMLLFRKWAEIVFPLEAKISEKKPFEYPLKDDTNEVRRYLHSLYNWRNKISENPSDNSNNLLKRIDGSIKFYQIKYSNLKKRDLKCSLLDQFDGNTVSLNDNWKLNKKLNHNKIEASIKGTVEGVADQLLDLQNNPFNSENNFPLDPAPEISEGKKFNFGTITDTKISDFINKRLSSCKPYTTGLSRISRKTIDAFPASIMDSLIIPIRESLTLGKYWQFWSINKLIAILKSNGKLRPITVQDCDGNLCEKFVGDRFLEFLEINELIYKHQHGFRSGHSCGTCFAELMLGINESKRGQINAILMADYKNAFGTVCHMRILHMLEKICTRTALSWIKGYFEDRQFKLILNGEVSLNRVLPKFGVPQGGAPSAIFWSFYINSLQHYIIKGARLILFADDSAITISAKTVPEMQSQLTEQLELIRKHADVNTLLVAPEKTFFVIFSKSSNEIEKELEIKYDDLKIPAKNAFRFLGIFTETKEGRFSFVPHYNFLKGRLRRASRLTFALRDLGSDLNLSQIYRGMAGGSYLHGTDSLPIPETRFLNSMQGIYNNTLFSLNKSRFKEKKRFSQAEILKRVGQPSLLNSHKKSLLNRLSEVFRTGKPDLLFDRVLRCLVFTDIDGRVQESFIDLIKDDRDWEHLKRKASFYEAGLPFYFKKDNYRHLKNAILANKYEIRMKYPDDFLRNASKVALRETFPYNCIQIFNKEPNHIRSLFGKKIFKYALKDETNLKCHHRITSKNQDFCKLCEPRGRLEKIILGNYKLNPIIKCSSCELLKGSIMTRGLNILQFSKEYQNNRDLLMALCNGLNNELLNPQILSNHDCSCPIPRSLLNDS